MVGSGGPTSLSLSLSLPISAPFTRRIMAEHESLEFGKADFVLLDQVTMEDFMENLKLR